MSDEDDYSHRIEVVDIDESPSQNSNRTRPISLSSKRNVGASVQRSTAAHKEGSSSKIISPNKDRRKTVGKNALSAAMAAAASSSSSNDSRIGSTTWQPRRVADDDTVNDWWATMSQRTRRPTIASKNEYHYTPPTTGSSSTVVGDMKRSVSDSEELSTNERALYQNRLAAAEARWAGVGAVYGEVLSLRRQRDDIDQKFTDFDVQLQKQAMALRASEEVNRQQAERIQELEKQVLQWKLTAAANDNKVPPLLSQIEQLQTTISAKEAEIKAESTLVRTQSVALARSQATLAGQSRLAVAHTQLQDECRRISSQLHDTQRKIAHLNGLLAERDEIVRAQSADLVSLRDRLSVARAREEGAQARAYAADQAIASGVSVTQQLSAFRDDYNKLLSDRMPCGDCKRRQAEHREEKMKLLQQQRTLEVALRLENEKRAMDETRRRERERDRRAAAAINGSIKVVTVERIEGVLTGQDVETGLWYVRVTCPLHVHQHDCPATRDDINQPRLRACDAFANAYMRAQRGVDLTNCLVFRPVLPPDE